MTASNDKDYLEYLVKGIVEHSEDVEVERTLDEMGVLLTLKVNPADMGQVIGKGGQTARSIRTLLRTLGSKVNARLNLKIQEPEGSEKRERVGRVPKPEEDDDLKL